jgi:hypothetical protein
MRIEQNNNADFDFDLHQMNVQLSEVGTWDPMELDTINLLQLILDGKVELKHHDAAMTTENVLVEYQHRKPGSDVMIKSGLSVTKADYYFFNIGTAGLFLKVDFIKWVGRRHKIFKIRIDVENKQKTGDNIGTFMLIPIKQIPHLLGKYEELYLKKPLKYKSNRL